ncbi:MAG: hypothetical protein BGO01_20725 [Armatimonadetes bacterium 55-13]|nr:hypothetical protein [Armatimonadota bacterium]OJU64537.1 MAG: hypothetical protein BGO01_20725 [Armatimonadetes bacterium 55-13]
MSNFTQRHTTQEIGKPIVCWVGSDFKGGTKVIVSDPLTLNRFLIENMQSREVRAYRGGHRIACVNCNSSRTRWSRHIDIDVWNEVPERLR